MKIKKELLNKSKNRLTSRALLKQFNIHININQDKMKNAFLSDDKDDVYIYDDEVKDEEEDTLNELIRDLRNLKTKRSLHFFIADNKEWINDLSNEDRETFLSEVKQRFFPFE